MISSVLRFFVKLVLALFAIVLGLGLLGLAVLALSFAWFRSLVGGKPPTTAVVFRRFQDFQVPGVWPRAARRDARPASGTDEVVDVQAREITDQRGKSGPH